MDFRGIEWGDVDWINVAQYRESSCEHGNEPSNSIKC
jgi:hypothetical protein